MFSFTEEENKIFYRLVNEYDNVYYVRLMDAYIMDDQLLGLIWLSELGYKPNIWTSCLVIQQGRIDIIQWMDDTYNFIFDERAVDRAALGGHLHLLKWFKEHGYPWNDGTTLQYAQVKGHHEVVEWLKANGAC